MSLVVVTDPLTAEQEKLFRFRYRIYVEEMGLRPPQADHTRKELRDWLDNCSISYALFEGEEVVGSLRVTYLADVPDPLSLVERFEMAPALATFRLDTICTTSRFMFDRGFARCKGVRNLIELAYRDAVTRGVRLNYGDCSQELVAYYQHLGYRTYAGSFIDLSYGPKVRLLMLLRDCEHFRKVRSPLAEPATDFPQDESACEWFAHAYCETGRSCFHVADCR